MIGAREAREHCLQGVQKFVDDIYDGIHSASKSKRSYTTTIDVNADQASIICEELQKHMFKVYYELVGCNLGYEFKIEW